jgi:hypothetical protein
MVSVWYLLQEWLGKLIHQLKKLYRICRETLREGGRRLWLVLPRTLPGQSLVVFRQGQLNRQLHQK